VSNIFAAPGSGYAAGRNANQAGAGQLSNQLLQQIAPWLKQQVSYGESLEPGREAALQRSMFLASPGNTEARQQLYQNQAFSAANQAARTSTAANESAGISPSYSAGQNTATANNAANQANQAFYSMESPEGQLQASNALMSEYQQGMGLPALSGYQTALSGVYGQPQPTVGQNPLGSILGAAAGDYLGGPAGGAIGSSLLGGSGSSGSGVGGFGMFLPPGTQQNPENSGA
jgi:hypothetical protein